MSQRLIDNMTDISRRVLQLAEIEMNRLGHNHIGTEHLLLGLIKEGSGVAANVLKDHELSLEGLRIDIEELLGVPDSSKPDQLSDVDLEKENTQLRKALIRLVDMYVANQNTPHEFITCITPKGLWQLTTKQRKKCKVWRAWDKARKLLGVLEGSV